MPTHGMRCGTETVPQGALSTGPPSWPRGPTAGWMWGPPVQAYVQFTAHTEGVPEAEVLGRPERMALPEPATDGDVAEAAVFLASDRTRAITGQSLLVDAGELMR